jgi:hypothetical protein
VLVKIQRFAHTSAHAAKVAQIRPWPMHGFVDELPYQSKSILPGLNPKPCPQVCGRIAWGDAGAHGCGEGEAHFYPQRSRSRGESHACYIRICLVLFCLPWPSCVPSHLTLSDLTSLSLTLSYLTSSSLVLLSRLPHRLIAEKSSHVFSYIVLSRLVLSGPFFGCFEMIF